MTASERASDLPPPWTALVRTLRFAYQVEPRLLGLAGVMTLFNALPSSLAALWLKLLADGLRNADRPLVLGAAIGLGASATLTWFLQIVFDRTQRRFRDRLAIQLEARVAQLQASIATIEHQERPEYLDRLQVLRDHVFALDHLFLSLFFTLGYIVRLAVTLTLLGSVHPLLLLIVVFALPPVWVGSTRPLIERAVEERHALTRRHIQHLLLLGPSAGSGKELRIAHLHGFIAERITQAMNTWYAAISSARFQSALWKSGAWAVFGAAYVAGIIYVAKYRNSPGALLLVLVAGSQLSQYVGAAVGELSVLRGIWLDSARRLVWLEDYAAASLRHAGAQPGAGLTSAIQFEGVTFRYPGTERTVLSDVWLTLPAGAVVAIVGENGAGKSTLIKLLCGLYTPTAGRILVDGVDLTQWPVDAWRARLAGAFQDFFRFEFHAHTSVGLGELLRLDDRPSVESAVARAGAQDVVHKLSRGLETQLGPKWSGGVELSFGQWQKLALARGFMRDQPWLLILDEPTAALDAETEHALFERFAKAARHANDVGRVTVLVSHRFSTVRMADLIVVLDGAKVVETGSHDELMARRGPYAELYSIQAAGFN